MDWAQSKGWNQWLSVEFLDELWLVRPDHASRPTEAFCLFALDVLVEQNYLLPLWYVWISQNYDKLQ